MKRIKKFLTDSYSKWFLIIAGVVFVLGIGYGVFTAASIRANVDARISEREAELSEAYEQYRITQQEKYDARIQACERETLARQQSGDTSFDPKFYRSCSETTLGLLMGAPPQFNKNNDSEYRKLLKDKEAPFPLLVLQNSGPAYWAIIGLVAVMLIRLALVSFQALRRATPMLLRRCGSVITEAKGNVARMPAFQRYLLVFAAAIVIILILILLKL